MLNTIALDAKTYWGASGSQAATELTIAREVSITSSAAEADLSSRASSYKLSKPSLKDLSIEITMLNDADDAGYVAFRNAYNGGTPIAVYARDRASGEGPDADFCVFGMSRPEPLEGEIVVSFTLKPTRTARAPAWN